MNVVYPPGVKRQYDPNYPIVLVVWYFAEPSFRVPRPPREKTGDPLFDIDIPMLMPADRSFWVSVARVA